VITNPVTKRMFGADLPLRPIREMGLKELERIRLILRGGSVIEWRRLHFKTREEVARFLRLCELDTADPVDEAWIRTTLADAVEYLRKTFNYKVTDAVANPEHVEDLFLYASGVKEPRRYRKIACIVLKVMHVIQHIEGHDLLHHLSISEAELAELATRKVLSIADEMHRKGIPVAEFTDSIKTRDSLVTKLLAKKETVAAQVYDKTRFRIITRTRDDILPVLYYLTQRLFPFNFVVPGQTENGMMPFKTVLADYPHFKKHVNELHLDVDYEEHEGRTGNTFSGSTYRVLNFIVNLPLRMDAYLPAPELDRRPRKCRTTFALVELQIVDDQTALVNERGENSHEKYKRRQKRSVLSRLSRGLVVPKREGDGEPPEPAE
jgi:uncharacterized protein (TIGR04552 family)